MQSVVLGRVCANQRLGASPAWNCLRRGGSGRLGLRESGTEVSTLGCHLRRGGDWDSEASLDVWRRAERNRRSG